MLKYANAQKEQAVEMLVAVELYRSLDVDECWAF